MRNLSLFYFTISLLFCLNFSYGQKNSQISFYNYLKIIPDSCYSNSIISKINESFKLDHITTSKSPMEYNYQQPYDNIVIVNDERQVSAFYDTINYLLLISDNFKSFSIKVFQSNCHAIIAFSEKQETEIEYIPIRTHFYKVYKNKVVDITQKVIESLDFCDDNFSSNTISYFDTTSYKIDCSSKNLNFYFTQTDIIWVVDCLYDISEEFGLERFFNKEWINGSDIARKYYLDRGKMRFMLLDN